MRRDVRRVAFAAALACGVAGPALARGVVRPEAPFRPELFFAGRTHAEGAFVDASGRPESRFSGDTAGRREPDGATVFRQDVRFDDGTRRDRTWRIVPLDPGHLVATATDMVGFARGEIDGRVLRLAYTVRTDPANPLLDVDFEQTMTLLPTGAVQNDSVIRKFGIVLKRASERFVRVGGRPRHPRGLADDRSSFPPHAEVAAQGGPRSMHDRHASFEARLCRAPQEEECGSFRPGSRKQDTRFRSVA